MDPSLWSDEADVIPHDQIDWDEASRTRHGPNQMQVTRVMMADMIAQAGHRRVLDVPCWKGRLTKLLLDRGLEVVSADLDPSAFLVPGHPCARADLNDGLDFKDGEFDAVACIEGIEHLENPHFLAREVNRVLCMGGKLYLSTPNILSVRSRLSYLLRGYPNYFHYMVQIDPNTGAEKEIDHINPIGYLELRYVLSRWGFRIDRVLTNRQQKGRSLFTQLLRLFMLAKGRRTAAEHPRVAEVRATLLSKDLLFGEALLMVATKVSNCQGPGRRPG